MKTPTKVAAASPDTARKLEALIAGFDSKHQALIRPLRKSLRSRFSSADELVYDYPHSLVIGYSPTGRGIESVVAIGLREDGLRLYFNQWSKLPDPTNLLQGSGKQARYIPVPSLEVLKYPEVEALLQAAADQASPPLIPNRRGTLIIQSGSTGPGKAGKTAAKKAAGKKAPRRNPGPKANNKLRRSNARKRTQATR